VLSEAERQVIVYCAATSFSSLSSFTQVDAALQAVANEDEIVARIRQVGWAKEKESLKGGLWC
jgi:hypothetical protein